MGNIICNIPHSSLFIPEWACSDFMISKENIDSFANKMVDLNVNKFFDFVDDEHKIVSKISRIVVDMERFANDEEESMAKLGMGMFYTHDDVGNLIRNKGKTYQRCLNEYHTYHRELEDKVLKCVETYGKCYVLDCHSFHDDLRYTGYDYRDYPDICLGFNETNPFLEVLKVKKICENLGYSVKLNEPFSGSLIPARYWSDDRVRGLMIEFNRRIYADDMLCFQKIKNLSSEIYHLLDSV